MFHGFSDATVDFMWGICLQNERTWFEAHKGDYLEHLYNPMKALATEVFDRFKAQHSVPGLCCKVSRIYRDARRLHGRGPYKDHLWWSMEHPTDEPFSTRPVFWFELAPEGWSYGLGYYSATPLTMAKFRARLERDPKAFESLARAVGHQDVFQLVGEDYKRPKGTSSPLLTPWYNKRHLSLECARPIDATLYSHALTDVLLEGYSFLLPYYFYFSSLEGDADPRV